MSENAAPGLVRQAISLLGDIGGVVAVVVAYVLAVSGRSPGPIPQTTAIITVLVTTVVVWVWRTRNITRRKPQPVDAASSQPAQSGGQRRRVNRLLDPFHSPGTPPYSMSLTRRRTELVGLAALTIVATGWSASRVPLAIPELTEVPSLTCLPAANTGKPRVVIANFQYAAPQYASVIEDRLVDALIEDPTDDRMICRLRQVVGNRQEAQLLGRQTRAVLVVWGRSDAIYDVHVELAKGKSYAWDPGRNLRSLPSDELRNPTFALREPDLLGFLTDFVLSQVLYLDNKIESARQLLGRALERAEAQKLTDNNTSDFGKAYFLLGYMYDPYVVPPPQADPRRALAGYSRSIELNPDFHAAILNRGKVFETLGELDRAFADYNTLIAAQGPLAADAAVNRAFLQIDDRDAAEQDFALAIQLEPVAGYWSRGVARQDFWDDLPGALADFQAVVKLEPRDYFYYESLGQAQLLSGQAAAARETYGEVITRLNQATRQGVIERLESLAQSEPDLADDIAPIVADLRAASLP